MRTDEIGTVDSKTNRWHATTSAGAVMCLMLLGPSHAYAAVYHVYPDGSGDFPTIQDAIDAAADGDEIVVHPGMYSEAIDLLGKAIALRSSDPNDPYVVENTIIDGNGAYHVVQCLSGEGPDTVLSGFTITGGDADGGSHSDNCGGGVFCSNNSNPTLANCKIVGNTASDEHASCWYYSGLMLTDSTITSQPTYSGGGVFCEWDSSPTLIGCTITGNAASWRGGGVFCWENSAPTLTDCTIAGNTANGGGGVYCMDYSAPTLTDCTITGNRANDGGGVVCSWDSSPTLTHCTITANTAICGGGMFCAAHSDPTLTDSIIAGNTASDSGGGVHCAFSSDPTLANCTVAGNTAQVWGGAVSCSDSNLALTNCMIAGNTAEHGGGGVFCGPYSSPTLTDSIIAGNRASDSGGGVYCFSNSNPTLANSILWDDSPQEIHSGFGSPTVTFCDVQGGWEGQGNIDADPLFVDPAGGDYHLARMSPCIDAGSNAAVPPDVFDLDGDGDTTEPMPFDLGGHPRFVDNPLRPDAWIDQPPRVDMGAYEFQFDTCAADLTGDGAVDANDLIAVLESHADHSEMLAILAAWSDDP